MLTDHDGSFIGEDWNFDRATKKPGSLKSRASFLAQAIAIAKNYLRFASDRFWFCSRFIIHNKNGLAMKTVL